MPTTRIPKDEYQRRLGVLIATFGRLPRGSRARASQDLRISSSSVSSVLTGSLVNHKVLTRLEQWVPAKAIDRPVTA